jgi:hypothetical protein
VEAEGDVATAVTLARILSSIPLSRGGPTSVVIFDIHALQARGAPDPTRALARARGGPLQACRPTTVRSHMALILTEHWLLAGRIGAEHERVADMQAALRPAA